MKENHESENLESRNWLSQQTDCEVYIVWDTLSADGIRPDPNNNIVQGNFYSIYDICSFLEKPENQNLVINHSETLCKVTYYEVGNDCDTILFVLAKKM